jgi:hypothetical protein
VKDESFLARPYKSAYSMGYINAQDNNQTIEIAAGNRLL